MAAKRHKNKISGLVISMVQEIKIVILTFYEIIIIRIGRLLSLQEVMIRKDASNKNRKLAKFIYK